MFELKVETHFAAAHQLKMVAKKCENLHGHNWKIEVCVSGKTLNHAGVLIDFGELKEYIHEVMKELDHRFLNELECFSEKTPPSSENIARYISDELEKSLKGAGVSVARITAWESEDCCATYTPPASAS
jgi:6-pyruvoyltetrahydropterin/6-carboxytetrahydropterin synthase